MVYMGLQVTRSIVRDEKNNLGSKSLLSITYSLLLSETSIMKELMNPSK